MTGWGRGICVESDHRGQAFGRGARGGGRGWRHRFWSTDVPRGPYERSVRLLHTETSPTVGSELRWLEKRSSELEAEQQQIKARLEELRGEGTA